jgi:hypothetical protein
MATIHQASIEGVNYKYHEPKPNKNGEIKGLMYTKVDKYTGEVKLKNGSGPLEKLMLSARGYTRMTETMGKKFLNAKFQNAQLSPTTNIRSTQKSFLGQENFVVRANDFQSTFTKQMTENTNNTETLRIMKSIN